MNENPMMAQHTRLEMRWLPVVDAAGRSRMEATWIAVPTHAQVQVSQAA